MCQQISPFRIKTILTSNGERLPTLIRRDSGMPVFDAALWVVSSLRNKGYASETINQALKSITILYIVLEREGINLTERLTKNSFLNPNEIESIVKACKTKLESLLDSTKANQVNAPRTKVLTLENVRMTMTRKKLVTNVSPGTAAIRLGYIREFLKYRLNEAIFRVPETHRTNMIALSGLIDQEFKNKTPSVTGRSALFQRMGLTKEAKIYLLQLIESEGLNNPWKTKHTQIRNKVIILSLLELGVRRSELLGVRIRDICAQGNEIEIHRRPDDKDDPRLYEPNTKTRDRLLPLSANLNSLLNEYISIRRNIVKGRHDFLFVANGAGDPLSKSEFNRLFKPLKQLSPLLTGICPHVIRHTYFESLCEDLDKNGVSSDFMESILLQLGGWAEGSKSIKVYTKRYAQNLAHEAAKSMQEKLRINI